MAKLDKFFDSIRDGVWHSLDELSRELSLQVDQLVEVSESLAEKGLVKYDERRRWVKMIPGWECFLSEGDEEEKTDHKPAVGTVILPPQESVRIQDTHITNATSLDVELWIKVCKKLTKLAIGKVE